MFMPPVPRLQKNRDAQQVRDTTYNVGLDLQKRISAAAEASLFYRRIPGETSRPSSQEAITAAIIHVADKHALGDLNGLKSLRDHAEWGEPKVDETVRLQKMQHDGSAKLLPKSMFVLEVVQPPDYETAYQHLIDPASRQANSAAISSGDLKAAYTSFDVSLDPIYKIDLPIIALGLGVLASAYYLSASVPLPVGFAVALASISAATHTMMRLQDRGRVRTFTMLQQGLEKTAIAYQNIDPVASATCRSFGQFCNEVLTQLSPSSSADVATKPTNFVGSSAVQMELSRGVENLLNHALDNDWNLIPLQGVNKDEAMRTAWQYQLLAPAALERDFNNRARGKTISRGFHGTTLRAFAEMMQDGPQTQNLISTPNGGRRYGSGFYLAQEADWALHWAQRAVTNLLANAGRPEDPLARFAAVGLFDMVWGEDCEIVPGHTTAVVHRADAVLLRRLYLYDTDFWAFRIPQSPLSSNTQTYGAWNHEAARSFWLDSEEGSNNLFTYYSIACGSLGIAATYATYVLFSSMRHQPGAQFKEAQDISPGAAVLLTGFAAGYAMSKKMYPLTPLRLHDVVYDSRRRRLKPDTSSLSIRMPRIAPAA